MDDLQSTENLVKNTPTAEKIGSFIHNRRISLREISKKSGITVANLSKCFTGKTMLTLPYFVRIVAASGSDDLYDWVFDIPVKRYLIQSVKKLDVCSGTDYVFLALLLKDYFVSQNEHNAEDILNVIFYALSIILFQKYSDEDCYDLKKESEPLVYTFCNMFYDKQNQIAYTFPEKSISDHYLGIIMNTGGVVLWQDVENLITWYISEYNKKLNRMNKKYVLNRIKNSTEQSYKVDDLLDADEEMQMNGIFFSACCLAAKNNIMLNKICTDDSNPDMNLLSKMQYGISSFFSCLRILEQDDRQSQDLQNFLTFFRQTAAASQYHMAELRGLSETFHDFLPINSFRFYL